MCNSCASLYVAAHPDGDFLIWLKKTMYNGYVRRRVLVVYGGACASRMPQRPQHAWRWPINKAGDGDSISGITLLCCVFICYSSCRSSDSPETGLYLYTCDMALTSRSRSRHRGRPAGTGAIFSTGGRLPSTGSSLGGAEVCTACAGAFGPESTQVLLTAVLTMLPTALLTMLPVLCWLTGRGERRRSTTFVVAAAIAAGAGVSVCTLSESASQSS